MIDDAPQLRRKDDTRYRSLERRVKDLETAMKTHESNVEKRLDRLEQRLAFAAGAIGALVVVANIVGPVVARVLIGG